MPDESLTGGTSPDAVTLGDTSNTVTTDPAVILAEIALWEAKQARPLREFAISGQWDTAALARINMIDDEIRRLRSQL